MDAHELYVKYNFSTLPDDINVQKDANTIQLARMMGVLEIECTPVDISKLTLDEAMETKEDITTSATEDITTSATEDMPTSATEDMPTVTNTPISIAETKEATVANTPITNRHPKRTDRTEKSECLTHYIHECDTLMVQHSSARIDALVRAVGAVVDIKWVHSFASRVLCEGPVPSETYETYRPDSDRHVHIVNSSVMAFVDALSSVQPNKITTFAWSHNSNHAIHLQKLDMGLLKRFKNVKSVFSATILASIGLPMHELFKIKEYFTNTRTWRFKNMTSDSLIKTALRPKVTIQKIDEKLEANQLLKEYNNTETLFDVQDHPKSVEMFLFKHWYSYPTGPEMKTMIDRAAFNLNKWTSITNFSNVAKKKKRRHRKK